MYTEPLILLCLALVALGLLRVRRRSGPRLIAAGAAALFLISWWPAAWLVSRPLEARYPHRMLEGDADVIVVLSGRVEAPAPEVPVARVAEDTYKRCFYASWLHKNWRPLPVLVSGGGRRRYADTMAELLKEQGVPASMIWIEDRSGSTHTSAVMAAGMLRQRGICRIALVTEAYHMLRSERSFRKQGLEVLPAPCAFRTFQFNTGQFLPNWNPIAYNEAALHEYVGLLTYWVRGWI